MKQVSAFETSDGSLFKDGALANRHQRELDAKTAFEEFWNKHGFYDMNSYSAANICVENLDALCALIEGISK